MPITLKCSLTTSIPGICVQAGLAACRSLSHTLGCRWIESHPWLHAALESVPVALACAAQLCGSSTHLTFMYLCCALVLLGTCLVWPQRAASPDAYLQQLHELQSATRLPALSQLRALTMLQTVFSILAVDFPLYPRRFAKTAVSGTSLMDLGSGGAIFSVALVRRVATEQRRNARRVAARRTAVVTVSLPPSPQAMECCAQLLRHAPLLAVGAARLVLVRAVDYHETHSEYGVHWNFFFTLALAASAGSMLAAADARVSAFAGVIALLAHQVHPPHPPLPATFVLRRNVSHELWRPQNQVSGLTVCRLWALCHPHLHL